VVRFSPKSLSAALAVLFLLACAAYADSDPPAGPPIPETLAEIRAHVGQVWHDMRAAPHEPADDGEKVVYGVDDRVEVYQTTDPDLHRLAEAACLLC